MHVPSSRNLSHDFPAYKGMTLRELAVLSLVSTVCCTVLFTGFGLAIGYPLALGCLGFLAGFIASVSVLPKPLSRIKTGKPHGFLMKTVRITFSRFHPSGSPYVMHTGVWCKSKRIGRVDV